MSSQMQISLLDKGGLDLHSGLTPAYTSKPSDGQWTKIKQELDKEQETSVTTQFEDNDANAQVLQNKKRNGKKRVYECPLCLKQFDAPSKLKRHCLIHTDQRPYQCSTCFRGFRERSHLKAHFRTHTNPSSPDAVTSAEKEIFPVSKSSDRLCTLQLKKKSGHQCKICLKRFSFPSKLTRHLFVHSDHKAYTCTICRKSFKQAYYLHKHLKVHTGKRNVNSGLCRVSQKHGAKLSQNVPLTESNSSTVEIKSSNNTEVQIPTSRPIDLKHTHKGVNQCSICLKNFPYPSKLARHILSHRDIRPFKCHVCLKLFQFRWDLQSHVRIHKKKGLNIIAGHLEHNRSVSFSNAVKSEEQDVQISLQDGAEDSATVHQHQNTVIENMINHKMISDCSDSDVYLKDSLLEGLDLHSGQSYANSSKHSEGQWKQEKQESEEGQEASVTTQSMDNDVSVKVTQSKIFNRSKRIYDCPVCHKRFGAPSKLKRHCLIHTNQRPYQCSTCCRAFRERSHLKVHMRTHTNPVKSRTRSLQRYKDNSVPCNYSSKTRLESSPRCLTVQYNASSTGKQHLTVHQQKTMIAENVASQIVSGDYSESDIYLQDSLLNKGVSSEYSSNPSEGQWMEEIQESEEEQEASVTTQTKNNDVNSEVWQSKNSNRRKKVYDCPVCHKRFGAPSKLKRHCLIHTNQRPFQCSVCCRAFRERSHLKVHMTTHNNPVKSRTRSLQRYKDNSMPCNQTSNSRLKSFSKNLTAQNDTCLTNKQKTTPADLIESNVGTMGVKVTKEHRCPLCLKCFKAPSNLRRHILIHTGQRPFKCSVCPKTSSEKSDLKVHKCTKDFIQEFNYILSDRQVKQNTVQHNASEDFVSTTIDDSNDILGGCSSPDAVTNAEKKIFPVSPTPGALECIEDGGNVDLPQILDSLKNKMHVEPECQSKLSQNVPLTESNSSTVEIKSSNNTEVQIPTSRPIDLKHTHKGVNQCSICLKNFPYPSKLARHILSHTDIRPFKCHVCLKSFQFRWDLQSHVRIHKKKGLNIIAGHLEHSRSVSFSNAVKSEEQDVQIFLQDGAEDSATVHQHQNTVIENMINHKMISDCSDSDVYLKDSLLEGLDLHSGQSYSNSSKHSEGQWKQENQESEEGQEASVTTQSMDNDVSVKVSQSKIFNRSKRIYDCPVCHKRFGAPSKLKRHCLIHTNQRPYQCSTCCRAFRERSHLKVHMRTHTNPVKSRTRSLQRYKDNSVPCNYTSKTRLESSPRCLTVQYNASSTGKQHLTVHQQKAMIAEHVASQIVSGDYSESDIYLQDSLLNKGVSSEYSSNPSEGQWMEEIQESEEEQEAGVTTQAKNDVNSEVWQSKNSNRSKKVHDCPVCHKRFGAPSKLKRHCLIHTNQRPFQCSVCCRAFRERSHLKVHMTTHNIPRKRRTPSLQRFKDNKVSCNQASKPSPKCITAHNDTMSTNKQKSTLKPEQNVLTEDVSAGPFENVENKGVFPCNSKSVWGLMHKTDILLDEKKASDIVPFGRVSDCPPKTDSSLHHCASESRAEREWAHHMDDIEEFVFVDSDSVVTGCDSYKPSSCQNQENPDVPSLPEVVVELEDFMDEGECFIKSPHDLPFCPDCNKSFSTIRNLYAHNCSNRYQEAEKKKSHQCDMCFKFFNAPSKLKRHYITHTGQRPFQCTQCQKSFTQSYHLKTHMLSHR